MLIVTVTTGLVYIEDRPRLVSLYRERFEFCPAFATCAARSQLRNGIEPLWHSSQSSLLLSMEKLGEEESLVGTRHGAARGIES